MERGEWNNMKKNWQPREMEKEANDVKNVNKQQGFWYKQMQLAGVIVHKMFYDNANCIVVHVCLSFGKNITTRSK